jgi:hypothetical protein
LVVVAGVAQGCLPDQPQIPALDLSEAQSFLMAGGHQQNQLANLLVELRNVQALIVQNTHQSASNHAFLQSLHLVLEDRLTKSEVLEVVAIRTVFPEEKTEQDDSHAEHAALLIGLAPCFGLRGEEGLSEGRVVEVEKVEEFEGLFLWKIDQVLSVEGNPELALLPLLLNDVQHQLDEAHPLQRSVESDGLRAISNR